MKRYLLLFLLLTTNFNLLFSQQIIESNNKFSFDIYKELKNSNENFIFSPASITSAMAMTYAGSKNNTLTEISNTFYFNNNLSEFHKDFYNLSQFSIKKSNNIQFYNANSIWIQKDMELKSEYLKINKQYYSTSAILTDFKNNHELSRKNINNWVEKNTQNKITNLLKPSSIDNSTRLVLVNALYFKGAWKKQFKKDNNSIEVFQIGKSDFVDRTFMKTEINSWYYQDKYTEIIDIPYSDKKYSLMIILPKSYKKLKKVEKKFNYDYYLNYTQNKKKKRIKLTIPKFNIETDFDLNKTLEKMGIKDAFNSSADFTGITESEKLYISNVVHKATIIVNEEGTEAAAATAVIMRKTSMLIESVEFKANRPFIYILRNNENNCIYFMGKILDPEK